MSGGLACPAQGGGGPPAASARAWAGSRGVRLTGRAWTPLRAGLSACCSACRSTSIRPTRVAALPVGPHPRPRQLQAPLPWLPRSPPQPPPRRPPPRPPLPRPLPPRRLQPAPQPPQQPPPLLFPPRRAAPPRAHQCSAGNCAPRATAPTATACGRPWWARGARGGGAACGMGVAAAAGCSAAPHSAACCARCFQVARRAAACLRSGWGRATGLGRERGLRGAAGQGARAPAESVGHR